MHDTQIAEKLDAWTREVVAWHFNEATGSRFWLDFRKKIGWNPETEIKTFGDLSKFGEFQDSWLRKSDVHDWIPKAYVSKPIYVFETGGSTGVPKTRINVEDFRIDYKEFSDYLCDEDFPRGRDWLFIGPTGPRRLRLAVEYLAQARGGICFCVDMDPRWVIKLIKRDQLDVLEDYKAHVIDQSLTLLRKHHSIECLFTTPKLLEALCQKVSLKKQGISGVVCGGTHMTSQFHRFAREELLEGAAFVPTYGNTMMGLAKSESWTEGKTDYSIIYYPPLPRAVLEVVNPDKPSETVEYGKRGRVKLTTLTKEFFLPNMLERDEGTRHPPCEQFPWDGVKDVSPFQQGESAVVEGVY